MNTKYIVFGGIALTAGAIGVGGGGMAIWCLMNRRPPQYSNDHRDDQPSPQKVTFTRGAAPGTSKKEPLRMTANGQVLVTHSIIVNGRKIAEAEAVDIRLKEKDDDDNPSEPVITVPVHVKQVEPSPIRDAVTRVVVVNGQEVSARDLAALDFQNRAPISNGQYWYDGISGAWGCEGGPCEGFIEAGMTLGGKLDADASHGDTGVFVNGRQLHRRDVAAWQRLGPVHPGRYWVNEMGNWGIEGGAMMGNLKVAAPQVAQISGVSYENMNSGGTWGHRCSYTDSSAGSDGEAFYYIYQISNYISNQ